MVDSTVDGAQDHRQGLVHKDEYDGYLGQLLGVLQLLTPGRRAGRAESEEGGRHRAVAGHRKDARPVLVHGLPRREPLVLSAPLLVKN